MLLDIRKESMSLPVLQENPFNLIVRLEEHANSNVSKIGDCHRIRIPIRKTSIPQKN